MRKDKLKIGLASTRRDVFNAKAAQDQKDMIIGKLHRMEPHVNVVDIDDINAEGLLFSESDISKVVEKFQKAGVAGVFFPHCNFGSEDLVAKVASRLGVPVLIWGPRDDAPGRDGQRSRDTQCGLFATGKVLRRFNIPFSYIVNCRLNERPFARGFAQFVAVCGMVRAFRNLRILQIAPRPAGFWTMICSEGELLERFNIQVTPVTLSEVAAEALRIRDEKGAEYERTYAYIQSAMDCTHVAEDAVQSLAALKAAIEKLCADTGCSAVAIQCWTQMQELLGIMPCVANAILTDEGLPVTCETDIHGAVSAILLQEAVRRRSAVFFADLTIRHPENDNAELLWHCGNFPLSLIAEDQKASLGRHFVMPSHCPGTGEFPLKHGHITVCRFDGDHGEYSLFMGEGKAVDGPKTKGTYVWFQVRDWPMWERKLVMGPYVHHCAGTYGQVAHILYEACRFIPGLNPDPAQPDLAEIERRLRN